jgi:hypothetical protein
MHNSYNEDPRRREEGRKEAEVFTLTLRDYSFWLCLGSLTITRTRAERERERGKEEKNKKERRRHQ